MIAPEVVERQMAFTDLDKESPRMIAPEVVDEPQVPANPFDREDELAQAATLLAKENRELLDSMYCYCNCKETIGHKSLLSCYADNHAVSCGICQDQAFYAASRFQGGDDIAQVRFAVDKKFWKPLR